MRKNGRVGRPPAGDSAATRRRIVQVARWRFARDGFRATTNRRIADEAGVTSSALYHYFASKSELYAAVYCDTIDALYSSFEDAAAVESTLLDQFVAVLRRASELQLDDPSLTGFLVAVALETQRQPDLLELMAPQRGRHQRFFTDLVTAAAERGELRDPGDAPALADLLGAMVTGLARMAASADDPQRYAAAVDVLARTLDGSLLTL
jgi:AcrR family transcriptional regulator